MSLSNQLDNLSRTTSTLSSTVSTISGSVFKVKLFFIVGICTFVLGLGIGLCGGIYWGYKKWTKKADQIIEVYKTKYEGVVDKMKDKIKEKL